MPYLKNKAFTLAELLIALSIIGIIVAFTVPKILTAQQQNVSQASLKDTYSTITAVATQAESVNQNAYSTIQNFILNNTNAVKICQSVYDNQCDATQVQDFGGVGSSWCNNCPRMVLPTGSHVMMTTIWYPIIYFWIDTNGLKGPNQDCVDQFDLQYCSQPGGCSGFGGITVGFGKMNGPNNTYEACFEQAFNK